MRVAAIQMQAGLGEVEANLERAEHMVERAAADGAEWVILPEFFTSAMAMDDLLLEAARPVDGEPARVLTDLAARHGIVTGGSFLAIHPDDRVRNTFVLAGPDGVLGTHDKDIPTMLENCYYEPGDDDGIIETPLGPVGAAVCWELIRSRTVRRLRGRVRLVVGGSCWWDAPQNIPPRLAWRAAARQNRRLWQRTLPEFARLVGVPVVHASWCGSIAGRWALGTRYVTRYLANACVVDAAGRTLAARGIDDGPGIVAADVELRDPAPAGDVPRQFWLHPENRLPHWRLSWWLQNVHGRRYRRRTGSAHRPQRATTGARALVDSPAESQTTSKRA